MWKGAKQAEVLVDMPRIPLQSWQLVQAAKRVLTKSIGHKGTYQWTKVRDSLSLWLTFSFVVREPVSWCAISQAVWRCSAFSRSNKFDNSPVLPTGWLYLSKEDTWRAKTTGNFSHSHTSGKLLQHSSILPYLRDWDVLTSQGANGWLSSKGLHKSRGVLHIFNRPFLKL